MAKGVVTITTAGPFGRVPRGSRLTTSTGPGKDQTFWVVRQKSPTVLIVASTWRDSPWVLWFMFVEWIRAKWEAIRSRFRREDDLHEEEAEPPLFVPPADDSTDEVTKDPKMLN